MSEEIKPAVCNRDILENGDTVAELKAQPKAIENWVKEVAIKANVRLDWHYVEGTEIARVLHLGDAESRKRAEQAIAGMKTSLKGNLLKVYTSREPRMASVVS
jgi:hypothetical protein